MKTIAASLITLLLVVGSGSAGIIPDESEPCAADIRVYQTQPAADDEADAGATGQDSSGTPTDLILDEEPEC